MKKVMLTILMVGIIIFCLTACGSNNTNECTKDGKCTAYALWFKEDRKLVFINSNKEFAEGDKYNDKVISNVYTGFDKDTYKDEEEVPWYSANDEYGVRTIEIVDEIKPVSTAYWFFDFSHCKEIINIDNLDTSNVTDMRYMFTNFAGKSGGYTVNNLNLDLSSFNTSNVTNMSYMFRGLSHGYEIDGEPSEGSSLTLNVSNWDTSKLVDMTAMFQDLGSNIENVTIIGLDNWNTSNVTTMKNMFNSFGLNSNKKISIGNLNKWNISKVTDMSGMFKLFGYKNKEINIGDLSNWDTSKVTDMSETFWEIGGNSNNNLNLSSWNVKSIVQYNEVSEGYINMNWNFSSGAGIHITEPNWEQVK